MSKNPCARAGGAVRPPARRSSHGFLFRFLGRRDHPVTGRAIAYVAAVPLAGRENVRALAGSGLAEVRWATLAGATALMPGMYGPVREYLARVLAPGRAG